MGLCNPLHIFPLSFPSVDAASLWLLPSCLPTFIEQSPQVTPCQAFGHSNMKSNQHMDCPSAPNLQAHRALSPLPSTLATALLTPLIHSALLLITQAHHTSLPRGSCLSQRLFLSGLAKVHFSCATVLAEAHDIVLRMQFPLLPVVPHPHLSIHPFTAALTLALCSVCTYSG